MLHSVVFLFFVGDYEQCSEDDGNVILDDPKGMTLQEIELLTTNTSEENLATHDETEPEAKCVSKEMFIYQFSSHSQKYKSTKVPKNTKA